jgi:hypothetical protein
MEYLIDARPARLVIALVVSAAVAVAACGGSAAPSPRATSSPSATSAAAVDPCLVGTWRVVGQTENSPADDENIKYTGGEGEVFIVDAQGGVTIDTHAAKKLVFVSADQTFSAVVAGTGRGTLSTTTTTSGGTRGSFQFVPSADDTRTIHPFDSTGRSSDRRFRTPRSRLFTRAPRGGSPSTRPRSATWSTDPSLRSSRAARTRRRPRSPRRPDRRTSAACRCTGSAPTGLQRTQRCCSSGFVPVAVTNFASGSIVCDQVVPQVQTFAKLPGPVGEGMCA